MIHKMALKKDNRRVAIQVTGGKGPCAFCQREVDDEIVYGMLYRIGDIQCHYYCCLLSCCLIQKGHDEEGLFGFMYTDIQAELERCKKHKCSYCGRSGANLGCSVSACRKQFHLPCGRERNAVSLYYGTYKSFCQKHAPKQKIPEHIMAKARLRKKKHTAAVATEHDNANESTEDMVCLICYEEVDAYPTLHTFWPPCCGKDAWFHRTCLQRMALSAGMHYLKCPLCNDKENFYEAVVDQGYYVPDRDAAWELEQNAFAEIYERCAAACSAERCLCPHGREHDADNGKWDIKLCLLCGSAGAHAFCIVQSQPPKQDTSPLDQSQVSTERHHSQIIDITTAARGLSLDQSAEPQTNESNTLCRVASTQFIESITSPEKSNMVTVRFVCSCCLPAAPEDLSALASSIESIIEQEQAQSACNAHGPIMPSRMSIRRTKGRLPINSRPSSSRSASSHTSDRSSDCRTVERLSVNLKPPENEPHSPLKLLERGFREKMVCSGVTDAVLDEAIVEKIRTKFMKPRPMCEKKKIVNDFLDGLFKDIKNNSRQDGLGKEWCSPKQIMQHSLELRSELGESPIALEKQDKENNSNTINTATRLPKDVKIQDVENKSEHFITRQNDDASLDVNDIIIAPLDATEMSLEKSVKNPASFQYNGENNEMDIINTYDGSVDSINNIKKERSEVKNTIEVNTTPERNLEECNLKTENSTHKTISNVEDGIEGNSKHDVKDEEMCEIECIGSKTTIEELMAAAIASEEKINDSILQLDSSKDTTFTLNIAVPRYNDNKKSTRNIFKQNSNKRKISHKDKTEMLKGIGDRKNSSAKNNDIITNKSFIKTKSLKKEVNILKRLVTEKDLCSQLLLELTTGKSENQNTYTNSNEYVKVTNEIPKGASRENKFTDNKVETTKLQETPEDSNGTPKYCIKTPIQTQKHSNIHRECKDINYTPKISSKTSINNRRGSKKHTRNFPIPTSKDRDPELPNTIQENPKHSQKNLIHILKGKKDSALLLEDHPNILIDTPKHKIIEIKQDSSLEISENDQSINIDVIKIEDGPTSNDENVKMNIPEHMKTCFKFSSLDKETLEKNDIDIDLESFKKEYLSEVDRMFQCNFKHKHIINPVEQRRYGSPIDFALDAAIHNDVDVDSVTHRSKRKLSESGIKLHFDNIVPKKRRTSESSLKLVYNNCSNDKITPIQENTTENRDIQKNVHCEIKKEVNKRRKKVIKKKRKVKKKNKSSNEKVEVTIDSTENRNVRNEKIKTKIAIKNKNIHVKIKWKKQQLSLNIESKKINKERKRNKNCSKLKQYILQIPEGSSKEVLVKPDKMVVPLKRKFVKQEKTPDKMKQLSIQSFFLIKSEK